MNDEEVLAEFRASEALLEGHFLLSSGRHSGHYLQCARVLMNPSRAARLASALATRIPQGLRESLTKVVSPAMGGVIIGHEMGRALGVRHIFAEKQDNKLVLRRGFKIEPGQHFVVGEDVMTRGGRIQETIDIVRGRGGVVDAVAVLVDRSGGKAKFDVPVYSLIQMEPVTWQPAECPLCKQGMAVEHPGS